MSGIFGLAVWFFKKKVDDTDHGINFLRDQIDHIKSNYLHRSDFKEFKDEVRALLLEIRNDIKELSK